MLQLLINAEQFERFCHTKYPGTKRFSLEGSESLIPMLDLIPTQTARLGAIEAVIGMASGFPMTAREGDKFADGYVLSIGDNQIVLRKTQERGVPLIKPKDIVKEITSQER